MVDPKDVKIEFLPGCFDNFEGTQEELDELIEEIYTLVRSGELLENATEVDLSEIFDEDELPLFTEPSHQRNLH